jgi:hypothetical protein
MSGERQVKLNTPYSNSALALRRSARIVELYAWNRRQGPGGQAARFFRSLQTSF